MKVGKDWAKTGRSTGSMVFCTGADADRLSGRLVDVAQPTIKG